MVSLEASLKSILFAKPWFRYMAVYASYACICCISLHMAVYASWDHHYSVVCDLCDDICMMHGCYGSWVGGCNQNMCVLELEGGS